MLEKFGLFFLCCFILLCHTSAQRAILPRPTGPYKTGSKIFQLVDKSRYDTLLKQNRVVIVQAWYPCAADDKGLVMDYIPEKKLVDYIISIKYYGVDSAILRSFYTLKTSSIKNAKPLDKKMPLLFFSTGFGILRANYTSIYEELASHGIIVFAVDHLYAGTTILPEGKIVDVNMYPDTVYTALSMDCVKDESFILNNIKNKSDIGYFFSNKINFKNVGSAGHSFGGNIAILASYEDKRIAYNINLDGGDFSSTAGKYLTAPSLILRQQPVYTDEELIKKGRDPIKWRQGGEKALMVYKEALKNARPGYLIKINETGHLSFSDAPYLMPKLLTMFLGKYLSPDRNRKLITESMIAFIKSINEHSFQENLSPLFKKSNELTVVYSSVQ